MHGRRWIMDVTYADIRLRSADVPTDAEMKMRVVMNHDRTWAINLQRHGDTYDLVLQGNDKSSAATLLSQIMDFAFGPPR